MTFSNVLLFMSFRKNVLVLKFRVLVNFIPCLSIIRAISRDAAQKPLNKLISRLNFFKANTR